MDSLSQLGPAATALVAAVALIVGVVTVRQKAGADRRDQWWKRAQWAIDQALDDRTEERRTVGLNAMLVLGRSRLAGPEELDLLESFGVDRLTPLAPPIDLKDHDDGNEPTVEGAV